MKDKKIPSGLTAKQMDWEQLDMLGASQEELEKIMTPEEIKEMKEYFNNKPRSHDKDKRQGH